MKKIFAILSCVACVAVLSACNTVQGIGKGVQKAGEAVESVGRK